jgi:hypothetical protein
MTSGENAIALNCRLFPIDNLSKSLYNNIEQVYYNCQPILTFMTPPLTYPLLEQLTRKSARRLYGQFTVLRKTYSVLELHSAGNGTFVLVLADWLFEPPRQGYSFKQTPVKEEELTQDESRQNLFLLNDSDQEEGSGEKPRQHEKFCKHKPLHKPMRVLSPSLREKLLASGIFPILLDEIAVSAYSEDELYALLAWAYQDQPKNPAPLFIIRLRAGAHPPEAYRQPACPYCGKYGGEHDPECRGRYLSGDYADFLEH